MMLLIHDGGLMGLGAEHDERAVSARAVGLYRAHANVRQLSRAYMCCQAESPESESAGGSSDGAQSMECDTKAYGKQVPKPTHNKR